MYTSRVAAAPPMRGARYHAIYQWSLQLHVWSLQLHVWILHVWILHEWILHAVGRYSGPA